MGSAIQLHQLDEGAPHRLWVYERDAGSASPDSRPLIDQAGALVGEMSQGGADVGHGISDVMQPLTMTLDESANRRVGAQRLQQLHVGAAKRNHGLFHALLLDTFSMNRLHREQPFILGKGVVQIADSDAHVVDVDELHGVECTDRRYDGRIGIPEVT